MKETKVIFQDPESRLFEINKLGSNEPEQKLTEAEFQKLEQLMPGTRWIVIRWEKPPKQNK